MSKITFVFVCMFLVVACQAEIITVDDNGPADFNNIQAAIDYANNGDTIVIQIGIYQGEGNRDIDFLGKAITVQSTDPCNLNIVASTIIDCNGNGRGFYFHHGEGENSILTGITIFNGYASLGGGIYCIDSSPTIERCVITENIVQNSGGGIYCDQAHGTISECHIYNNISYGSGGGIDFSNYNTALIKNCIINNNSADNVGGGIAFTTKVCKPTIINCIIRNNISLNKGGGVCVRLNAQPYITNSTIVSNTALNGGGAIFAYDCAYIGLRADITNCIIWNNQADQIAKQAGYPGRPSFYPLLSYCDVEGGWSRDGPGNIGIEPLFIDPCNYNYNLDSNSPCIDVGTNSPPGEMVNTDIAGNARISDGNADGSIICDMGAYEYTIQELFIICYPKNLEFSCWERGENPSDKTLTIQSGGTGIINWEITEDCAWLHVSSTSGESSGEPNDIFVSIDSNGLDVGIYTSEIIVSDNNAFNSPQIVAVTLEVNEPVIVPEPYIENTPSEFHLSMVEAGAEPSNQLLSISNGGGGVLDWQIIEDCNWVLVIPTSGNAEDETDEATIIFDASTLTAGQYNCELVIFSDNATNSPQSVTVSLYIHSQESETLYVPLQFFTIQRAIDVALDGDKVVVAKGTYTGIGNRDIDFKGKEVTVQSMNPNCPEVVASTIIDCNGAHRAFRFWHGEDANSVLNGLTIKNGYVWEYGGGIYCNCSSPTIANCNFVNCSATYGGGIACDYSSALISNCTFTGNSADKGGAISTLSAGSHLRSTHIENCQIFGNTAERSGGGINCDVLTSPVISNCLIAKNHAGTYGGGGISIFQSNPKILNCTIVDNVSDNDGGGILNWYEYETGSTLENCIVWGNRANTPNTLPSDQITLSSDAEMTVNYCDIEDDLAGVFVLSGILNWGTENFEAEPVFVTGQHGNYYLSQIAAGQMMNSPCLDRGNESAANLGMDAYTTRTDQVVDEDVVDIGYHYSIVNIADINGDGKVNWIDYGILASQWSQTPSLPSADISPVGGDNIVDSDDLKKMCENWLCSDN